MALKYLKNFDNGFSRVVINGLKQGRITICEQDFKYFCLYYFPQFFHYKIAPFHLDMYQDLWEMDQGKFDYLIWLMFRESAKTSLSKMFACWCAIFKKKRYINFDSYEKENAEAALFDIALWFQTNQRLVEDYGQLYWEERLVGPRVKTLKRLSAFVTTNKVKFEAFSTQESTRGRIYQEARPDLFVLDDIETFKTQRSSAVTQSIIQHIDEMLSGIAPHANVMFLGNYLSENGVMAYLLEKAKEDLSFKLRRVDVEIREPHKKPTPAWPDKYTMTDEEAAKINKKISDPIKRKVSLESKKRTLNAGGRRVYEVEMMNDPESAGELVFDRRKIDEDLKKVREPIEEIAGFKIWVDYNPKHRYAGGADTSKGVGRSACASAFIDFSRTPALLVASYANNKIAPDIFAHELKRQGNYFGGCLLAPEVNNTGYATITELKTIYDVGKIYMRVASKNIKIGEEPRKFLGWETNSATKYEMIYQFKSAYEAGQIEIWDAGLLKEMRAYTQTDLEELEPAEGVTKHFDKLIAVCIAWAMRSRAEVSPPLGRVTEQEPYIPSEFEGGRTRNFQLTPLYKQPEYKPNEFEGGKV